MKGHGGAAALPLHGQNRRKVAADLVPFTGLPRNFGRGDGKRLLLDGPDIRVGTLIFFSRRVDRGDADEVARRE